MIKIKTTELTFNNTRTFKDVLKYIPESLNDKENLHQVIYESKLKNVKLISEEYSEDNKIINKNIDKKIIKDLNILIDDYFETFEEICNLLQIPVYCELEKYSEKELNGIHSLLKNSFKHIWKEF